MITHDLTLADEVTIEGRTIDMAFEDHRTRITLPRTQRMTHWFRGDRCRLSLGSGRNQTTVIGRPLQIQSLWNALTDTGPDPSHST